MSHRFILLYILKKKKLLHGSLSLLALQYCPRAHKQVSAEHPTDILTAVKSCDEFENSTSFGTCRNLLYEGLPFSLPRISSPETLCGNY